MASMDKEALKAQAKEKQEKAKAAIKVKRRQKYHKYVNMPAITGDVVVDAKANIDAVKQGFRDAIKKENQRFEDATDSGHWFCACFQSRKQVEFFLEALGLPKDLQYVNGELLARILDIKLPEANIPYRTEGKIDKSWLEFVN